MNEMGNKILINEIWYNSFSNTRKERVKQLLVKHVRASGKNDENNELSTMHATGLLPTCVQGPEVYAIWVENVNFRKSGDKYRVGSGLRSCGY